MGWKVVALGAGVALLGAPMAQSAAQENPAQGASILVEVSGVRTAEGSVRVDICTAATFLKASCPYHGAAMATVGATVVTVANVPPGVYAAQVYHDVNDNHLVDRNFIGIPREDIGFSNNAPLGLRGPAFARASFTHADAPQVLALRLRHFESVPRRDAAP